MRKRKLAHLRGRGLNQFLVAVAERRAPKAGHAFDVGLAVGIVDIHALGTLDDQRSAFAEASQINVGMDQGLDVANGEIAEWRHESPFRKASPAHFPRRSVAALCSPIVTALAAAARGVAPHDPTR